jgi:hypothetical protein
VAPVTADEVAADFILLTHGHGDHVADAVALAKRTGALVISNLRSRAGWAGHGVDNTAGMNTGGAHTFPFGRVKLTIAHHSSVLPDGAYAGNPYGFLINFNDGHDLYIAGDTALTYDMKLIGDVGGVDLAILPIGDYFTMGAGRRRNRRAVGQGQARHPLPLQHLPADRRRCGGLCQCTGARGGHRLHDPGGGRIRHVLRRHQGTHLCQTLANMASTPKPNCSSPHT